MIIKGNSKKDNTIKNNYKLIYQKIKEEIKSIVITKLLNQVQILYNNYQKLQKENSIIKNDLIYILKRVLLNKKDYMKADTTSNTNKNYQMKSVYSMPYLTNTLNQKSYNSVLSSDNIFENNNNYIQINKNLYNSNSGLNNSMHGRQLEKRRYSIDDDPKKGNNSSLNNLENSNQFNNLQNKIDYYLNNLYKHNFAEEIISGNASVHLINKDKPLYEELFSRKNKNYSHFNTEFNFKKIPNKKFGKKNENRDYNYSTNTKTDNQSDYNKFKNNRKDNNILKVQRKNVLRKNKNLQIKANTGNKLIYSDIKNTKFLDNSINGYSRFVYNKNFIK